MFFIDMTKIFDIMKLKDVTKKVQTYQKELYT